MFKLVTWNVLSVPFSEAIPDPLHLTVPPSPAMCGSSVASSEAEFTSTEGQSPDVTPGATQDPDAEKETEEEKALRLLYCSLCKVAVNSASQLEAHNSGESESFLHFPSPRSSHKLTLRFIEIESAWKEILDISRKRFKGDARYPGLKEFFNVWFTFIVYIFVWRVPEYFGLKAVIWFP